jgi:hypothetical protein
MWAPWLLGAAGLALVWAFPALWLLNAPWRGRLLDQVVVACSIFVAYLLTAASILPAVEEKAIIQRLRSWGYYKLILLYIGRAAWAAGFLLLLSLAAAPLPPFLAGSEHFNRWFSAFWWAALFFTVSAVFVATRILLKVLRAR